MIWKTPEWVSAGLLVIAVMAFSFLLQFDFPTNPWVIQAFGIYILGAIRLVVWIITFTTSFALIHFPN